MSAPRIHGHATHASATYKTWQAVIDRCLNPKCRQYPDYGGRGITVCERWRTFTGFLADMGERPAGMTIDRFPDVNGGYEPSNCRWATPTEQARNRRSNRLIEFQGRAQSLAAWCEELGLAYHTVWERLKSGHSVETAFLTKGVGRYIDPSKNRLTAADVAEIRALRGKVGQRQLAKRFGVSAGWISELQSGAGGYPT